MKFVTSFGYALAALFASTVGVSMMGTLTLWQRMAVVAACAALGAYVGWNRKA